MPDVAATFKEWLLNSRWRITIGCEGGILISRGFNDVFSDRYNRDELVDGIDRSSLLALSQARHPLMTTHANHGIRSPLDICSQERYQSSQGANNESLHM